MSLVDHLKSKIEIRLHHFKLIIIYSQKLKIKIMIKVASIAIIVCTEVLSSLDLSSCAVSPFYANNFQVIIASIIL